MRTDENRYLFWKDVPQEAIKLDINAQKLSWKRRALTRIKELFSGKAATEYANDVVSHYRRNFPSIVSFESLD